jgi:hypothetical protein
MLLLFYTFLLFFLVLHVPHYYFFIDSNRAGKIAMGPEVISQVGFLLHLWVAFKQLYSQLSFQYPHQLRNRYLRWNRQYNMDMVTLDAHLLKLTFFPFTQQLYIIFYELLNLSSQDLKSIWGTQTM